MLRYGYKCIAACYDCEADCTKDALCDKPHGEYESDKPTDAPCPKCGQVGRRVYSANLLTSTCHPTKGA